jgi:hypothetical protein
MKCKNGHDPKEFLFCQKCDVVLNDDAPSDGGGVQKLGASIDQGTKVATTFLKAKTPIVVEFVKTKTTVKQRIIAAVAIVGVTHSDSGWIRFGW